MNRKYKRLFSDTILFAISKFGSKILTILLVPLYTSVLSTEDYGTADIIITTACILYPILTLSISDATLRFTLDSKTDNIHVFSNSVLVLIIASGVLIAGILAMWLTGSVSNAHWCFLLCIAIAIQMFLENYIKGCGKTKIFAIQGLLYTFALVLSNIFFLLIAKIGLKGYLFSVVIANVISTLYMFFSADCMPVVFGFSCNKELMKEMLQYSIPMIPTTIAWWINAAADKYMLTGLIGASANGLYAIAHKIPTIYSTMTGLFSQAWRISAISNYEDTEKEKFYANVYNAYSIICIYACFVLIGCSQLFAKVLFKSDYYSAWVLIPPLLISALFDGYSTFLISIYAATKQTNLLFISTGIGAVFNVVLNWIMINCMGIIGAPIASFIGFIIVWGIRSKQLCRVIDLDINYKSIIPGLILLITSGMYFAYDLPGKYGVNLLCFLGAILINIRETRKLFLKITSIIKRR